jgi:hypothetical protein
MPPRSSSGGRHPGDVFNFPLQSVESVTPVNDFTLLVGLDNNYPGGNGRVPETPDDTEIITLRSKVPLRSLRVDACRQHGGSRDDDDDEHDDDDRGRDSRCR